MLASMHRLAKKPSARATNGDVCTTLGGATATPRVILRNGPVHDAAACSGGAPAARTCGVEAAAAGVAWAAGATVGWPAAGALVGAACAAGGAVVGAAWAAGGALVGAGGDAAGAHALLKPSARTANHHRDER